MTKGKENISGHTIALAQGNIMLPLSMTLSVEPAQEEAEQLHELDDI